ncbi:MAG: DUF4293 family protein [Flavobacteriales bacterium]|nr:hypothetical protein [Flavobacteriales bacterium]MCC6576867.1 DUF4293 family protein [Flavobacteriales bacterium]NUQ16453.1 DUF4293 family protein [Flavobacteriales bacterium]
MVQRKQTLFLALAALVAGLANLFPFATYTVADLQVLFRSTGLFMGDGTPVEEASPKVPFAAVLGLLALLPLVTIAFYKDRARQLRFVRFIHLFALGTLAFAIITDRSIQVYLGGRGVVHVTYGAAFAAPLLVLLLAFLAERGIRKDEALIRSMDRLR